VVHVDMAGERASFITTVLASQVAASPAGSALNFAHHGTGWPQTAGSLGSENVSRDAHQLHAACGHVTPQHAGGGASRDEEDEGGRHRDEGGR